MCGYSCWVLLKSTRSAYGCGKGCRLKVTLISEKPVSLGTRTDGSMRFSTLALLYVSRKEAFEQRVTEECISRMKKCTEAKGK